MYTIEKVGICIILLLSSIFLNAQGFDRPNGFGGNVLFLDHASFQNGEEPGLTTAFEVSYNRHFNKFLSLRIPFKAGILNANEFEFAKNRSFYGADLTFQATLFGNQAPIAPFVYAGFGGTKEESLDLYTQVPIGGGLNFKIAQWAYFQIKAEYRSNLNNELERENMQYGVGLVAVVGPTVTTKELEKMLSDRDGDGVEDDLDRCPDIPGKSIFGGCLDSDDDGIGDADDSCPDDVGLKALNGCPDTDSDGVADIVDDCPDVPGTAYGCPDADKDGIADAKDRCPDIPGQAGYEGCPEDPAKAEMEEDIAMEESAENKEDSLTEKGGSTGVNENNTITTNNNSNENSTLPNNTNTYPNNNNVNNYPRVVPESALSLMADATKRVQFNVLSDDLTTESYQILDQVVSLMITNPQFQLKVSGHTDDRGEDHVNQRLSEKRARACIRYLRDQGVPDAQMSYMGFGARAPLTDNYTEEGRRQNRRVDFELFIMN